MSALLVYFLKANIAFAALYLFFSLLLHRDTFFREKRFALLLGYLFAILHPFIDVSGWIQQSRPVVAMAQSLSNTLPEITVISEENSGPGLYELLLIGYALFAFILLLRIFWQTCAILILAKRSPKEILYGQKIVHLTGSPSPFSFCRMIFLNPDSYSANDLEEILHHERAHVRQNHTFDVLFAEVICALFWINPFVWLLKRSLRENLEYLADKDVLCNGFDPKSYQYHLLRLSYQKSPADMANHFNVPQLKNRIIMMNKKKTSLADLSKYALSLPLFAFLLLGAYAWGAKANLIASTLPAKVTAAFSEGMSTNTKEISNGNNGTKTNLMDEAFAVGYAQNQKGTEASAPSSEEILFSSSIMPQYPGGENALIAFISKNLRYPKEAAEKGIEGRVTIRFVVDKTGKVTKGVILKSLDPSCDQEALRVINMMPAWTPGEENGKNVSVYFTMPIVYKLQRNSTSSNNPLIIIDGVEKPYSYMNDTTLFSPKSIQSINILKDSTATAAYGEKGKYGVIIIKTKKK
jgi:TonB family protein